MRAGPALSSSLVLLSAGWIFGLGCFLDSSGYNSSTGGSAATTSTTVSVGGGGTATTTTTTTTTTGGTGGTTTNPTGGAAGTTMTTGGTGGMTGSGGSGGSGGMPTGSGGSGGGITVWASCKDALKNGMATSDVYSIDPDGAGGGDPFDVYCDQVNDQGGWALVYNSVGDPGGQTTAFWNIPAANSFGLKGEPALDKNYYFGQLYKYGTEYRDDAVDPANHEVRGIVRAKATGIVQDMADPKLMTFTGPQDLGSFGKIVYGSQFAAGWSSPDHDGDSEPSGNCALDWKSVTQHYGGCWRYSLGADADGDQIDMGWGPHIINSDITEINTNAMNAGMPQLDKEAPGTDGFASRMKRISRFTRW